MSNGTFLHHPDRFSVPHFVSMILVRAAMVSVSVLACKRSCYAPVLLAPVVPVTLT